MSETESEYAANYRKPPCTPASSRANPATPRAPRKTWPPLLAAALNEKVTVTENGKRRQVTKRERSSLSWSTNRPRATKMLIDILGTSKKGLTADSE